MSDDSGTCEQCSACGSRSIGDAESLAVIEPGMPRRMFLERTLMLAAAMLAACSGADATAPDLSGQTQINVSSYPELANVGGVALVTIEGSPMAIVRTGASTFLALSRICPHQGGLIVTTSSGFRCTRHGAQFTTTGTWTGGERTSNMRSYPTSYVAATSTLTVG